MSDLVIKDGKRMVLGFTVILSPGVELLRIEEIRRAIEAIPGVAAVEESSIPIHNPVVRM